MQRLHNVSKERQDTPRSRQRWDREPEGYSCPVCGGESYHLVLTAEALNDRVRLKIRCGACNASQDVSDNVRAPRQG